MKIAYIAKENVLNTSEWSGLSNAIYNCLKKTKFKVFLIHKFPNFFRKFLQIIEIFYRLFDIKYDPDRNKLLNKFYAYWIEKKIKNQNFDYLIFHDTPLISYLNTNIPIILWTDLTFDLFYKTYFNKFKKFHKKSVQNGLYLDQIAFKKIDKFFIPSMYVKKNLQSVYNINKKKIYIIPFASNFKSKIKSHNLKKIINNKILEKQKCIRFLSVGVDWLRKGMNDSIKFIEILKKNKINARIDIVGSNPPNPIKKKYIFCHGYLKKNNKNDLITLRKLYSNAHYFLLLSNAEAFGIVFQEACSYALPIITKNIDGIKNATPNKTTIYSNKKINFNFLLQKFKKVNNLNKNYAFISMHNYNYFKQNNWILISQNIKKILIK